MVEIREYNRLAQQKSREKRKELNSVNDLSMTSQSRQGTDKDKELEVDKEIDKKRDSADKPRKQRKVKIEFTPPTIEEVKAYIAEKGYSVNPQTFYDYFTAGEPKWVDKNGSPVLNWKQKIVTWASRDKAKAPAKQMVRYIHPDENGNPIEGWREV